MYFPQGFILDPYIPPPPHFDYNMENINAC